MGFGTGNFVFLTPCQDGGENRKGRPGSREKEIGFERERERYRKRKTLRVFQIGELYLRYGVGGSAFRVFEAIVACGLGSTFSCLRPP